MKINLTENQIIEIKSALQLGEKNSSHLAVATQMTNARETFCGAVMDAMEEARDAEDHAIYT